MPAVNLMVAVSEEALGGDSELALRPLRQLRGIGVRLALARFGSRASSLAALHEPLFDALILSRSRSQGLALGGRGHTLVRGVVALAETRLPGAADFIALPVAHSEMLASRHCAAQIAAFLESGRFRHDEQAP